MEIPYGDLVLLNAALKEAGTRYRLTLKNPETGCVEPPGECCLTPDMEERARKLIASFFRARGKAVRFSGGGLYFRLEGGTEKPGPPEERDALKNGNIGNTFV